MHRICRSLSEHGYEVTLVGFKRKLSKPLSKQPFRQKRLPLFFRKGVLFYAEVNIRLFFYLLVAKTDLICAIDLDTILPGLIVSKIKRVKKVYDAHELFTETKELITRPRVRAVWKRVEQFAVPKFKWAYTVNESIAEEFQKRYGVKFGVIRNLTRLRTLEEDQNERQGILYQGAVNEARSFEQLVPAMKLVNDRLIICGDGNFMVQLRSLIRSNNLEDKIILKGMLLPDELWSESRKAKIGLTIIENLGMNQYFSLPNKFFDYIHAEMPQVAVNFPEYRRINEQFEVALLLDEISPQNIADAINNLLSNGVLYKKLQKNCAVARLHLNWQEEEKKLVEFYQSVFKA
jgi:glycosyltransferase involved in cell wall biosynthesis